MKTTGGIITLLTICFIGLFLYVTGGYAATIYVANYGDHTCSLTNAQSAYNAASAGDTIVFPTNGSATWSSSLSIGKPLTILGSGSTLTASGSLANGFFYINGFLSTSIMRISGFTFQMTNLTPGHGIELNAVTLTQLRIDHNTFHHGSVQIEVVGSKGVIDNNYFYNGSSGIYYSAGTRAQADASWDNMSAGKGDALFIEDNHFIMNQNFTNANGNNECIDTYNGGKLVIRYNHFDGTDPADYNKDDVFNAIQTHGSAAAGETYGYWQKAPGARRGQSVVEIYNNIVEAQRVDFLAKIRGSANLIHDNVLTTTMYNPRIYFYEEEYDGGQWDPARLAWPSEDQVHNTFIWNNVGSLIKGGSTTTKKIDVETNSETYIKKDRDYFLHAPCGASDTVDAYGNTCTHGKETFTGQNGASSSYPTDGVVHPTRGTMVFTPTGNNAYYGYTPYNYPHPLTLTNPRSAQNTRVVITTTTVP